MTPAMTPASVGTTGTGISTPAIMCSALAPPYPRRRRGCTSSCKRRTSRSAPASCRRRGTTGRWERCSGCVFAPSVYPAPMPSGSLARRLISHISTALPRRYVVLCPQEDLKAAMSAPNGPISEERLAMLQNVKQGLEDQVHRLNEDSKQVRAAFSGCCQGLLLACMIGTSHAAMVTVRPFKTVFNDLALHVPAAPSHARAVGVAEHQGRQHGRQQPGRPGCGGGGGPPLRITRAQHVAHRGIGIRRQQRRAGTVAAATA